MRNKFNKSLCATKSPTATLKFTNAAQVRAMHMHMQAINQSVQSFYLSLSEKVILTSFLNSQPLTFCKCIFFKSELYTFPLPNVLKIVIYIMYFHPAIILVL